MGACPVARERTVTIESDISLGGLAWLDGRVDGEVGNFKWPGGLAASHLDAGAEAVGDGGGIAEGNLLPGIHNHIRKVT